MKFWSRMNLPNKLTLIRIFMIPIFMIFAGCRLHILSTLVFCAACLTDWLDGRIAREYDMVTNFGKFADPIADKLLVMAALVILTAQGQVESWVCIILLGREFIISGFRLIAVEQGKVLAAGKLGKAKTATQMVAIIGLLLFYGGFLHGVASIVLYVSMILSVASAVEYIGNNMDCIR